MKETREDGPMTNPYIAAEKFAAAFRDAEYALKRSNYLRIDKDNAEADWDSLARDLGQPFFDKIVASGIAKTLISDPPRQLKADGLEWMPKQTTPLSNVHQLIVQGVCRVRNSYTHGEKFRGGPEGQWDRDATLIEEAHAVLEQALASL
jgi:hypothetical protein